MSAGIYLGFRDSHLPDRTLRASQTYDGDRHLVTFGPTGSGKNTTSQTPVLLEYDASALVIDVKGQLGAITTLARIALGHKVAFLNPFGVLGIASATYNPLSHLDPASLSFVSDCRRLAEGLVDTPKNDHWEMSALDVVTLLIMWVKLYEDDRSLVRVRQLLNLADKDRIALFTKMQKCGNQAVAEGANRYKSDAEEVADCIQTAVVQLGFLRDPGLERVLRGGPHEISFAELKRRKMTVFIIIPPELLHTHGKFLRLIVLSALGELIRETTMPQKPVLFMLDEFAQLGHMSIIENAASIVRDYKIRLWIILQNLPQLKALYGQKWESFLSSAGVIQFFTPNDLETAQYLEKRCGVKMEKRISQSTSTSTSSGSTASGSTSSSSSSRSQNISEAEVPYLPVHRLFELDHDSQVLVFPNVSKGIIAARAPYWQYVRSPAFMPDPYHQSSEGRAQFEQRARTGKWITKADLRRVLFELRKRGIAEEVTQLFPNITQAYEQLAKQNCQVKTNWWNSKITLISPTGEKAVFKNKVEFELEIVRQLTEKTRQTAWDKKMKFIEKDVDALTEQLFNATAASLQLRG